MILFFIQCICLLDGELNINKYLKNKNELHFSNFREINLNINNIYVLDEFVVKNHDLELNGKDNSMITSTSESTPSLFLVENKKLVLLKFILEQRLNSRIACIYKSLEIYILYSFFYRCITTY
jgi:hypothetical protein